MNENEYQLPFSAEQIEEKLRKIQDGGIGYTAEGLKAVLPETVLTSENYSTAVGVNGCFLSPRVAMEEGKKYRVVVDGMALDYVAEPLDDGDLNGFIIGNWAVLNPDYAGEGGIDDWPWLVAVSDTMGMYGVGFIDPAENAKSHTMAVYEIVEEVHPIYPKYIPGPVEINLNDYGIDLITVYNNALTSGGKYSKLVSGTEKMWEEFEKNPDFVLLCDYLGIGNVRMPPSAVLRYDDGVVGFVAINTTVVINGVLVSATIGLSRDSETEQTSIDCVVNATQL